MLLCTKVQCWVFHRWLAMKVPTTYLPPPNFATNDTTRRSITLFFSLLATSRGLWELRLRQDGSHTFVPSNSVLLHNHHHCFIQSNMTLTVVVGASGSGKTTFLNDGESRMLWVWRNGKMPHWFLGWLFFETHPYPPFLVAKRHKCTYIRQYHGIRPYIPISKIPRFDPTELRKWNTPYCLEFVGLPLNWLFFCCIWYKTLAYWDIYVRETTADTILAGGTMAGEFTGTCVLFAAMIGTFHNVAALYN